jgi:hypothetical protein
MNLNMIGSKFKAFILSMLFIMTSSVFADDCTVSFSNFNAWDSSIESILDSKGYIIDDVNPTYRLKSQVTLVTDDLVNVTVEAFKKGVRINSVSKRVLFGYMLVGGAAAVEKKFVRSLNNCTRR